MKTVSVSVFISLALLVWPLHAQDWTKESKDRAKRAALHDAAQLVRGDSGKWNDDTRLLHVLPLSQKPAKQSLDAWADQFLKRKPELTQQDDNWLVLRTEQLDDNDRVWIERIEKRGRQFTITANQAKWQGKYFRTFTYYQVIALNLGKLPADKYDVKLVVQPLTFKTFDGDGKAVETNWPKDERPAEKKPSELRLAFEVHKSR